MSFNTAEIVKSIKQVKDRDIRSWLASCAYSNLTERDILDHDNYSFATWMKLCGVPIDDAAFSKMISNSAKE